MTMVTYTVIVSASAKADLFAIYDYIADRAGVTLRSGLPSASRPIVSASRRHPNAARAVTTYGPACGPSAFAGAPPSYLKSGAMRGRS